MSCLSPLKCTGFEWQIFNAASSASVNFDQKKKLTFISWIFLQNAKNDSPNETVNSQFTPRAGYIKCFKTHSHCQIQTRVHGANNIQLKFGAEKKYIVSSLFLQSVNLRLTIQLMTRYKPITNLFLSYLIVFTHFCSECTLSSFLRETLFFFAFTNR